MLCPRCAATCPEEASFCWNCGEVLRSSVGQSGQSAGPASIGPPSAPTPPAHAPYPYSPLAGHSVLRALEGTRPPTGVFWLGVCLALVALVLCPCAVGIMLAASGESGVEDPAGFRSQVLTCGGCLFAASLLVSAALLVAGRPRSAR